MTYLRLSEIISGMTESQKNCDISVYFDVEDEYYSGCNADLAFADDNQDVLDIDHPFIKIY